VEVAEEEEHLQQHAREQHLRVPHGEAHRGVNLGAAGLDRGGTSTRAAELSGGRAGGRGGLPWRALACVRAWRRRRTED
jgi:hypothetical protein